MSAVLGSNTHTLERQPVSLRGEVFEALAAKALYWPRRNWLFVADLHLGKAAAFRSQSIPIPHGTTAATLNRLGAVLDLTGAERLVVLGDLWHDHRGRSQALLETLGGWTAQRPLVRFTLATGNHDVRAGKTPTLTGFEEMAEVCDGGFCGRHHPESDPERYVLCGHLHPGFRLSGGRVGLVAPCFWFGDQIGVLPAFGEFTGSSAIEPSRGDQVLLVAEDRLVSLVAR